MTWCNTYGVGMYDCWVQVVYELYNFVVLLWCVWGVCNNVIRLCSDDAILWYMLWVYCSMWC